MVKASEWARRFAARRADDDLVTLAALWRTICYWFGLAAGVMVYGSRGFFSTREAGMGEAAFAVLMLGLYALWLSMFGVAVHFLADLGFAWLAGRRGGAGRVAFALGAASGFAVIARVFAEFGARAEELPAWWLRADALYFELPVLAAAIAVACARRRAPRG